MRFLFVLLLLCPLVSKSQKLHDQLLAVNANWSNYALQQPEPARFFLDDRELIQTHLQQAIEVLSRRNFTCAEDARKQQRRKQLLNILRTYAEAGQFPQNTFLPGRVPVFIDGFGTYCAVAYLMQQSGADSLARQIAATSNFLYIRDIRNTAFTNWQLRSGFTVDELALIQPTYPDRIILANPKLEPACGEAYFLSPYVWPIHGAPPQPQPLPKLHWKGDCVKGVLNGRWVQYYPSGRIWVEGFFKNGLRDSSWREYADSPANDQPIVLEIWWKNGKMDGHYYVQDGTGKPSETGHYSKGLKTGLWTTYLNGLIVSTGNYIDGEKDGEWSYNYQRLNWVNDGAQRPALLEMYANKRLIWRSKFDATTDNSYPLQQWMVVNDSLYAYKRYKAYSKEIIEEGLCYVYDQLDSMFLESIDPYAYERSENPRRVFYPVEVTVRTGKWIQRGAEGISTWFGNQLLDSVWLYVQNDSIHSGEKFSANRRVEFECLPKAYTLPSRIQSQADFAITYLNTTTWENQKLAAKTVQAADGSSSLYLTYRNGEIVSGHKMQKGRVLQVTWVEVQNVPGVKMEALYIDAAGRILQRGFLLDTATRHGEWLFTNANGSVLIAKGSYDHNVKTGTWEETDTSSGRVERGAYLKGKRHGIWKEENPVTNESYSGQYVNGKRKGLWIRRNAQGLVMDRKNYY